MKNFLKTLLVIATVPIASVGFAEQIEEDPRYVACVNAQTYITTWAAGGASEGFLRQAFDIHYKNRTKNPDMAFFTLLEGAYAGIAEYKNMTMNQTNDALAIAMQSELEGTNQNIRVIDLIIKKALWYNCEYNDNLEYWK